MLELPSSVVRQWKAIEGWSFPQSISVRCPSCMGIGIFTTSWSRSNERSETNVSVAECPGCKAQIHLFVYKWLRIGNGATRPQLIFMHPDPPIEKTADPELEDILDDERLVRAYKEALTALNAGLWNLAALACGRVLEGITEKLLKGNDRKQVLAARIRRMAGEIDLGKPLIDLANLMKEGRNLGAHFDADKETSPELAKHLVDLLGYLLDYLFLLPARLSRVEASLAIQSSDVQGDPGSSV